MSRMLLVLCLILPSLAQKADNRGFFFVEGDQFTAVGKWIPTNPKDKAAFPAETQIDCFKSSMTCVEATAEYYVGYPHVTIAYLKVNKWDKNGLIATNSSGICMTDTVLVSFSDKTLSDSFSMKQLPDDQRDACKALGALQTEMTFVLRNSERWNNERKQEWLHPKN